MMSHYEIIISKISSGSRDCQDTNIYYEEVATKKNNTMIYISIKMYPNVDKRAMPT